MIWQNIYRTIPAKCQIWTDLPFAILESDIMFFSKKADDFFFQDLPLQTLFFLFAEVFQDFFFYSQLYGRVCIFQ